MWYSCLGGYVHFRFAVGTRGIENGPEAQVPYSFSALSDLLGYAPEQAVSFEVAERMALARQRRAEQLTEGSLPTAGVACTAALVTDRQRRD